MLNLILMGMAGSGKGTQAEKLSKRFNLQAISTGQIFRDEIASGSPMGKEIAETINKGSLVADDKVVALIKNYIGVNNQREGIVLDGFPRTLNQAKLLDQLLEAHQLQIDAVLYIQVDYQQLLQRLSGRFSCKQCGSIYNTTFKPTRVRGVCDRCQSTEFINRDDDSNIDAIKKRLELFQKETLPIVNFYERKNLIYSISGIGSIEDVENRIMQVLQQNHIINGLRG